MDCTWALNALRFCHNEGKQVCSFQAVLARQRFQWNDFIMLDLRYTIAPDPNQTSLLFALCRDVVRFESFHTVDSIVCDPVFLDLA